MYVFIILFFVKNEMSVISNWRQGFFLSLVVFNSIVGAISVSLVHVREIEISTRLYYCTSSSAWVNKLRLVKKLTLPALVSKYTICVTSL